MRKVKLLITASFFLFLASFSYSQETLKKSDGFFDNLYLGSLVSSSFTLDTAFPDYKAINSIRLGAVKKFSTKIGEFYISGTYDSKLGTFSTARWQLPIFPWLDIQAGLMPKPICLLNRPLPVSAASHFEPLSLGLIPASGLGTQAVFHIDTLNTAYAGIYRGSKGQAEYQLGYTTKIQGWEISTAINTDTDSIFSGSLRLKSKWIDFTVFKSKKYSSGFFLLNLPNKVSPYVSMYFQEKSYNEILPISYGPDLDEHLEIGLTKTLSKKWEKLPFSVNALFGAGYVVLPEKFFNIYFQFYIEI